jgi:hypothetical protein
MQVEKPLDIIHEIVEDDAIKASHKILRQGVKSHIRESWNVSHLEG